MGGDALIGCRARFRTLTRLLTRSEVRKLLVLLPKATLLEVEGASEVVEAAAKVRPRLTILRRLENLEADLDDVITASVDGTALS